MTELSAERASHLIGLIYDCVIDSARWQIAVEAVREELTTSTAAIHVLDTRSGKTVFYISSGISEKWRAMMLDGTYDADFAPAWGGLGQIGRFPSDEPIRQTEVVAPEVLSANLWIRSWSFPQGLIDRLALFSMVEGGLFAGMSCGIHESRPFQEPMRTGLRLLASHVRRAISISGLLGMKAVAAETLEAALDELQPAIVLVGEDLGVVHANASAREMLRNRDPISEASGRLMLPNPQGAAALADAVQRAAVSGLALGQRGIGIPTRRRDGSPALVHVLPLRRSGRTSGVSQRAVAAVFVAAASAPPQMPAAALALLHDLTPAETRVLELIVEGKQPADVAKHLGITLATVKTHLVRVFDKTGVNRQADLVRLVGSLVLPV